MLREKLTSLNLIGKSSLEQVSVDIKTNKQKEKLQLSVVAGSGKQNVVKPLL